MRLCNVLITSLALIATAAGQTTRSADDRLDFGTEGLVFPPIVLVNGHTPRTAQLLELALFHRLRFCRGGGFLDVGGDVRIDSAARPVQGGDDQA